MLTITIAGYSSFDCDLRVPDDVSDDVPDDGYSRNAPRALNLISTFSLNNRRSKGYNK